MKLHAKLIAVFLVLVLLVSAINLSVFATSVQASASTIIGDVDGSEKVNVRDATTIQKHLAKVIVLTEAELRLADTDLNCKVNIKDATGVQKWIAKILPDSFIGISYTDIPDASTPDTSIPDTSDPETTIPETTPSIPNYFEESIKEIGANIQKEAEANGGTITLKVWQPEAAQEVFKAQAADFIEIFKDYAEIEIKVENMGEADAPNEVIKSPYTAADVFGFSSDQIHKLASRNALAEVYFDDEVNSINMATSVSAATYKDKLVAYPEVSGNSYFLCYDKSVISDEQAKSLEGIFEACKSDNKKFVIDASNGYYSCMFLFTSGLKTNGLEEDGETQKFNDYDIDQVTASTKAFADLFKKYENNFDNNGDYKAIDGFKDGTTAAGIIGAWNVESAKYALDENAGFAILPTININGTDTQIINMYGYKFIGVNSQSKFPYTAQALAYYLSNYNCQQERAELLDWSPTNINAINSEYVKSNEAMSAIIAQSEYSVPQTIIVATFWDPVAALGYYIADNENDFSSSAIKYEIEKCINNITRPY